MPTIRYTLHAETVVAERGIEKSWIERTVLDPEWREPDPRDGTVERRFRSVPERDGRFLRVICLETLQEVRIVGISRSPSEKAAMMLKVEYDADANAAYIRFSTETVLESDEVREGIILDYDTEGHIVGMEVLDARQQLPAAMLNRAA